MFRSDTSAEDAHELALVLTAPRRTRVLVVVSVDENEAPVFDAAYIARKLGATADVHLLATRAAGFQLAEVLPDGAQVYGGAARAYPPGIDWARDAGRAPLYVADSPAEAEQQAARLVAEVELMDAGVELPREPAVLPARRHHLATVITAIGNTVMVALDEGGLAGVRVPMRSAVDLALLMPCGTRLVGTLSDGQFETPDVLTAADACRSRVQGTTVPALVCSPGAVLLFPGLRVSHRMGAEAGEVIAVAIVRRGRADGTGWRLSTVDDADPENVADGLPLTAGALPWIRLSHDGVEPELRDALLGAAS